MKILLTIILLGITHPAFSRNLSNHDIHQDTGVYLVTCTTDNEVFEIKISDSGNVIWARPSMNYDRMENSVVRMKEGGYILSGTDNDNNLWITMIDRDGNSIWKTILSAESISPKPLQMVARKVCWLQ